MNREEKHPEEPSTRRGDVCCARARLDPGTRGGGAEAGRTDSTTNTLGRHSVRVGLPRLKAERGVFFSGVRRGSRPLLKARLTADRGRTIRGGGVPRRRTPRTSNTGKRAGLLVAGAAVVPHRHACARGGNRGQKNTSPLDRAKGATRTVFFCGAKHGRDSMRAGRCTAK